MYRIWNINCYTGRIVEQGNHQSRFELDPDIEDWQDYSACDEETNHLFFSNTRADIRAAKIICSQCVVLPECLEYAFNTNQDIGVWGGLDDIERRNERRKWLAKQRSQRRVS